MEKNVVPIRPDIPLPAEDGVRRALIDVTESATSLLRAALDADDEDAARVAADVIAVASEYGDIEG